MAELRVLLDRVDAVLDRLEEAPEDVEPEPAKAIVGIRNAAELLGVGRAQVGRVLAQLSGRDERRPVFVTVRGGRKAPWWPSPEACTAWWASVHQSSSRTRKRPPSRRRWRAEEREEWSLEEALLALEG